MFKLPGCIVLYQIISVLNLDGINVGSPLVVGLVYCHVHLSSRKQNPQTLNHGNGGLMTTSFQMHY